ncbi:MAG: UPF0175 family protein [Candidatus Hydrogenedentes bacterium]|nr:UPF0175 family protein [Candidatus Hydrogenedentota bacterium]
MPLTITDETLQAIGLSETQAKLDIACRWFDEGKLTIGNAAQLAGVDEIEFETQLELRGIPRYRYTSELFERDLETLQSLERR